MTDKPKSTHGGARAGAGRKPAPPVLSSMPGDSCPMAFLRSAMNDTTLDMKLRTDAAKALMPFLHVKPGDAGKKNERAEAAKKASTGRFAPSPMPLKLVNG